MYEILDTQRMDEYAAGLNSHIRAGENFVESMRMVKQALDDIRHSRDHQILHELRQLREECKMIAEHLEKAGIIKLDAYAYRMDQLKDLVISDRWPRAIDPDYIASTDDAKKITAKHLLDLLVCEYLEHLKFLDYGCGGGFVAAEAAERKAAISVGYDPKGEWRCPPMDRFLLTQNLDDVRKQGPYDVILFYDVLDHCQEPVETLRTAKELLSDRGRIYVRNHPWCSKHGGHLYEHVNKAYVHVVFDEIEQMRLFGRSAEFVHKLTHPMQTYREWFRKAGLEVRQENPINEESIDPIFLLGGDVNIQQRLGTLWKGGDATQNLTLSHVHYVLEVDASQKNLF